MEKSKKENGKIKEVIEEDQYPHNKTQEQKSLNNSRKFPRTKGHSFQDQTSLLNS